MQIAKSFDRETLIKIGKGALITFTGAGSIAVLGYLGAIEINSPLLAGMVALIIPVVVNTIKEWMQGVPKQLGDSE